MNKSFTDRSRIETKQRCPRRRWLEYHEGSGAMGLASTRKNLALALGGSVHVGLAMLTWEGQKLMDNVAEMLNDYSWECLEDHAVEAALADFTAHSGALELDATEQSVIDAAFATAAAARTDEFTAQLQAQAAELGMSAEAIAGLGGTGLDREQSMTQFERLLFAEQSALCEALVRVYARVGLPKLLEQFEVLEVEREGEWLLGEYASYCAIHEIWFMSRPDALLRERATNELYLLSFKTTNSWEVRKAKSAEHDMQGLTEGVEVEIRLRDWWHVINQAAKEMVGEHPETDWTGHPLLRPENRRVAQYLATLSAPPRIHAIRYEYLRKGERWEDKDLSARLGMTVRTQRSHLIRQWQCTSLPQRGGDPGYAIGDLCWSWDFIRPEDQKASNLSYHNWKSQPVWEQPGGVKAWIDRLERSEMLMSGEDATIGMEPRVLGWRSDAQAMGVTSEHPLEAAMLPAVVVYRSDDELRDVIEQIEAQEVEVARSVERVHAAAGDAGEKRSLLNRLFPMYRHSCFYPTQCQFAKDVCYATDAASQGDPLAGGKFKSRVPNHPQEGEGK
jgi:hypothetical protein